MSAEIGFPQLDFTTYPSQIFWLVVTFASMYLVMHCVALPRVGKVLDERKGIRDGDLLEAEKMGDAAERLKMEYDAAMQAARRKSAETIAEAEKAIAKNATAEQERMFETARKRLEKANAEIAQARKAALQDMDSLAAEIAAEMTKRVANINTNSTESQKAVATVRKEA